MNYSVRLFRIILKCKVFILLVGLNVLFLHFSALDKYIVSPFA